MRKPNPVRIDRTDRLMFEILQREGRITNAELAERVHLSPAPCLRRMQRLEQAGVIAGYGARLDPATLGLGLEAFVRVQLEHHDPPALARFAKLVESWDEVASCHALTGDMDYLLHIVVEDLDHFSRFLLERVLNDAGVADVNSSFVLRTVKQAGAVALPQL